MDLRRTILHEVQELEPLVMRDLAKIEEGLLPLGNQIAIGRSGRPDVFAVDDSGTLCLLELKSVPAGPETVAQALRYYEWVVQNLAMLARPFPEVRVDGRVRLLIVAPEFTPDGLSICKYLDSVDITLVQYDALKDQSTGQVGLVFRCLELAPTTGPATTLRSLPDILQYCKDAGVRKQLEALFAFLKENGFEVRPSKAGKDYYIEATWKGADIVFLQPLQRFFACEVYDEATDDYERISNLKSHDEWLERCWGRVQSLMREDLAANWTAS